MANTITITNDSISAALDRIVALGEPGVFARVALEGARLAGITAESVVSEYPPPRNTTMKAVRGKTFLTAKQRRWFFANLRNGNLQLPYYRTGKLGQSLASAPFSEGDTVGFSIGTNRNCAKYVWGQPPDQAAYHQDWWTPLYDNLQQNTGLIGDAFVAGTLREIRKYINGS